MERLVPGLAKLPEKRKITQTEKCQRYFVYDRSKRNRGYIKEWEKEYAWLAYDDENNAIFCSSWRGHMQDTSTIVPGKECVRNRKAGLVKSLAD